MFEHPRPPAGDAVPHERIEPAREAPIDVPSTLEEALAELADMRRREKALLAQSAVFVRDLRHLYDRDRERRALERRAAGRIRHALANSAINIVFQPIVDLSSGNTVGMEALSRFAPEPHRPPDEWFSDAADAGLLVDLEIAAIEKAVASFEQLPSNSYISLNASPATLTSPSLVQALERASASRVVIEITEHAPINEYEAARAAIDTLREAGGRLAIDDTGAGFASLRHILSLSPDIIKLDITLTRGLDHDMQRRALARALISFASDIGAVIVAEGVETKPELEALRSLGVRYGQGFFLGRPAPLS